MMFPSTRRAVASSLYRFRSFSSSSAALQLHGQNFVGFSLTSEGKSAFTGFNPKGCEPLDTNFVEATESECDRAMNLAAASFDEYQSKSSADVAAFLRQISANIVANQEAIVTRAGLETGLPDARLNGETGRTTGQLELFARLIEEGSWVEARIDVGAGTVSDLRRMLVPVGPVVVFGASNFPLAFSTAGGDTASALAAKCPVVVKAHPAHPGTSELVAEAVIAAARTCGMPEGVFSMVHGTQPSVGQALVAHPAAAAVGFTGSLRAGRSLFNTAAARQNPIPVFAEMGSVNPVVVFPGAMAADGEAIAKGLAGSITLGAGQFCTNPGLLLVAEGSNATAADAFVHATARELDGIPTGTMLTPAIRDAFESGLSSLSNEAGVSCVTSSRTPDARLCEAGGALLQVSAQHFVATPSLAHEVFGPSSLAVRCADEQQLLAAVNALDGQLTASVFGTAEDLSRFGSVLTTLQRRVGRLVFNGYPTGVEVCSAMTHGGPYPATTAAGSTSVGSEAIKRFVRPITFQDTPQELLPTELRDANDNGVYRLVNNTISNGPIDFDYAAKN